MEQNIIEGNFVVSFLLGLGVVMMMHLSENGLVLFC